MKTIRKFFNPILIVFVAMLFSSCANIDFVKRKYMTGYHLNKVVKSENVHEEIKKDILLENAIAMRPVENTQQEMENQPSIIPIVSAKQYVLPERPINYADECDEIILKNGDILKGKVTDIGVAEIKYKKCDNLTGPTISILKSDVFMIKYANGSKDVFNTEKNTTSSPNKIDKSNASTDGFSIASLITGIFGLLGGLFLSSIAGIVFGILGIVFGAIGIGRINKHPEKHKGKGFAITGLVTGITITVLFLAFMVLVISLI